MLLLSDFVSDIDSTYYKWNFTNRQHEEILTSVGRITVFLFLCMYILDFMSYFILALCFPNIELQIEGYMNSDEYNVA